MNGHFAKLDDMDFPSFEPGHVWLVGAGPGAPGLISLLGYYAMSEADVIVYDALVSEGLLGLANPDAGKIHAGKRGGKPSAKQADITIRLIELAKEGKRVLRLKGGDPFMFGRGGEEAIALHNAGVPFRIVPGISAGMAGPAYAGIPVTHRDTNHAVIFLTGHDGTGTIPHGVDWNAVATAAPVIVMFMAVKHLDMIAEKLIAAGRDPDDTLFAISNASLPNQTVVRMTLKEAGNIAHSGRVETPSIFVLGPVADFHEQLDWFLPDLRTNPLG